MRWVRRLERESATGESANVACSVRLSTPTPHYARRDVPRAVCSTGRRHGRILMLTRGAKPAFAGRVAGSSLSQLVIVTLIPPRYRYDVPVPRQGRSP